MTKKVLVIDDEKNVRRLLKRALRRIGFECIAPRSIREALSGAREDPPDLIILDLNLEGKTTGWDVLETLKTDEKTSSVPVAILSGAFKSAKYFRRAYDMGAAVFLSKPFSPREITEKIKELTGS